MPSRILTVAALFVSLLLSPTESVAQTNPVVVMETSLGDITIELFQDRAPISVENFLAYANDGFYEGTVFHLLLE